MFSTIILARRMTEFNALFLKHRISLQRARLDEAHLRKRSAVRGETVVEVKAGNALLSLTEGWAVERFVVAGKKDDTSKKGKGTSKKSAAK